MTISKRLTREAMRVPLAFMAALTATIVLTGCPTKWIDDQKKKMLLDSITHCSSALLLNAEFSERWRLEIEGTSVETRADVTRSLSGIMTDEYFRQYLLDAGIDPLEFLDRIIQCQTDFLEREGYFDFIRPLPPPPATRLNVS